MRSFVRWCGLLALGWVVAVVVGFALWAVSFSGLWRFAVVLAFDDGGRVFFLVQRDRGAVALGFLYRSGPCSVWLACGRAWPCAGGR